MLTDQAIFDPAISLLDLYTSNVSVLKDGTATVQSS
jgi:hypothetical protein